MSLKTDILKAFKGGISDKGKFIDLLVLLYELFMLGRRKGTPALDEHVSDPTNSSIFTKYHLFSTIRVWLNFFAILFVNC